MGSLHGDFETLGDTSDHVLDVGSDGAWHGVELAAWEPNSDADLISSLVEIQWAHVEVTLQFTAWSLNGDFLFVNSDGDALWDMNVDCVLEMHFLKKAKWCELAYFTSRSQAIL